MQNTPVYKLEIFIPPTHLDDLRKALRDSGAGIIGNYDSCTSSMPVTGTWRPLTGASPYDGVVGQLSTGSELKVEVNCPAEKVAAVVEAVRVIHPYEEPLINIIPLHNHLFTPHD